MRIKVILPIFMTRIKRARVIHSSQMADHLSRALNRFLRVNHKFQETLNRDKEHFMPIWFLKKQKREKLIMSVAKLCQLEAQNNKFQKQIVIQIHSMDHCQQLRVQTLQKQPMLYQALGAQMKTYHLSLIDQPQIHRKLRCCQHHNRS